MAKDNTITISDFQKGMAVSSYFGFEEFRGLNIQDKPGIVTPVKTLSKQSTTINTALIVQNDGVYGYDDDGKFYKMSDGSESVVNRDGSTAVISDMTTYKGYRLLPLANGTHDAYDGTTYDKNWDGGGFSDVSTYKAGVWADNDAYYLASSYIVDKLVEDTTFDPTDSDTWTITQAVLTLPSNVIVQKIEKLGDWLFFVDSKAIYPWDKYSEGYETPLRFGGGDINQTVVVNNLLYVQAGNRGYWYVTNGSSVEFFTQIPDTLMNLGTNQLKFDTHAVDALNDDIYFGVGATGASTAPLGVYKLDTRTKNITIENIISSGEFGENDGVRIGSINASETPTVFLVSWSDIENSTFGWDNKSGAKPTDDSAYFISQFYNVGTDRQKRTFSSIEFQFAKALVANDSVKIYYRTTQDGSFDANLIGTVDADGDTSKTLNFGLSDVKNIQFKVVLNNTVELLLIRIK